MGPGILLIMAGVLANQFEAMTVKHYGQKHESGGMFFNAMICLFSMIYFIVTDKEGLHFPPEILFLGLINSAMYALGFYTAYLAYQIGSFGLTKLLTSFGSVITILYGILFLKEPATIYTTVSVILIFISVFLMNYRKSNDEKSNISFKWIFFVILVILSNAFIAILGRIQFGEFGNTYKNEFLIVSYIGASLSLIILGFIFEREKLKTTLKTGFLYGMFAGICNGINNLIILITYNYVPISISSPVKTGLGIIVSFLASVFLYREKFSRRQVASVIIGILAVVLINLK